MLPEFATRNEALARRADIEAARLRRRLGPAEGQLRFDAWAHWWLDQTAMVDRPATAARDRSILRAHLVPAYGTCACATSRPSPCRSGYER